jgi:hypothetical protein
LIIMDETASPTVRPPLGLPVPIREREPACRFGLVIPWNRARMELVLRNDGRAGVPPFRVLLTRIPNNRNKRKFPSG